MKIAIILASVLTLASIAPAASAMQYGPQRHYQEGPRHNYQRDLDAERRWSERQWRYDRRSSRRDNTYVFIAGVLVGSVIQDRRGEYRQYYRDYRGQYYYYNYDRQSYNWDYDYRPYARR